jgi:hypothetical protein
MPAADHQPTSWYPSKQGLWQWGHFWSIPPAQHSLQAPTPAQDLQLLLHIANCRGIQRWILHIQALQLCQAGGLFY